MSKPVIIHDEVKVAGLRFSHAHRGQRWVTKYGWTEFARVTQPFLTLDDTIQRELSRFVNRETPRDISLIMYHYEVDNIAVRKNMGKQIYQYHPSYRGGSWFDWFMVKYKRGNNMHSILARLYLWMKFNGDHTCKGGENIFGFTQSLATWKTLQYRASDHLHVSFQAYSTNKMKHWMKTF
eukprot:13220261-Ditylum_brightwellii.AAC.1